MIKCGHCPDFHSNVAAVRRCALEHDYRWANKTPAPVAPVRELRPVKPTESRREAARRQVFADLQKVGQGVPEGRYAIRNQSGPNDVAFYHVTKYNTATRVRQLLSDEEKNLSWERQLDALVRIAANVQGAMALFGQKTVRCGHCNRRLTNQESRERGIGPVCAKSMGFAA